MTKLPFMELTDQSNPFVVSDTVAVAAFPVQEAAVVADVAVAAFPVHDPAVVALSAFVAFIAVVAVSANLATPLEA